jgi:hypothetical protein
MKKTTTVLAALAIGAAAIGISIAPPSAADDSNPNCQTVGGTTVCAQGGDVRGGDQFVAPPDPVAGPPDVGGCLTQYGTYQNCGTGGGG